jgi:hypothetical protein
MLVCMSAPICDMREKLKFISGSGDCSSKKCKQGYGDTCSGVWWSLRLAVRSLELSQAVGFVLVCLVGLLTSVVVKMFSHLIYFIKKFYKFCTFIVICKDNVAINFITLQHKTRSFPSILMGHTTLVFLILLKIRNRTCQNIYN